ncbi:MAG: DsrE family protein [Thermoplasmata archaeon]|nr:DsrE family protein [Thermoplasmata archaeon]
MARNVLIIAAHGTYGRDDDAFGTMLMASSALSKGVDTTLVLVDDGASMAVKAQDTSRLGLPNNYDEAAVFIDLGGKLFVMRGAMEERGIREDELLDGARIIDEAGLAGLIVEHDVTMTF